MKLINILILSMAISGCATKYIAHPSMTGGSKSDGVVEFKLQYNPMVDRPQVDFTTMDSNAIKSCSNWGYSSATPMSGKTFECKSRNTYGSCIFEEITYKYQCTN